MDKSHVHFFETVRSAIKYLHDQGYRIWYDEGIDPGNEWPEEVAKALANASLFLVFISSSAVNSRNVRNEINFALNNKKPFIAVYIMKAQLPMGLELRMGDIQAVLKYSMDQASYSRKMLRTLPAHLCESHVDLMGAPGVPIQYKDITEPKGPPLLYTETKMVFIKRINLLGILVKTSLGKMFLVTLLIGLALNVWSYFLSAGLFWVKGTIIPEVGQAPRPFEVPLGYIHQLNYGFWYAFLCPLVYLLASLTGALTKRIGSDHFKSSVSFTALSDRPWLSAAGIVLLIFFVGKSVYVEWDSYPKLGLGWVQAEFAQKWGERLAQQGGGAVDISERKFNYIDIRDKAGKTERVRAKQVLITAVHPSDMRIRSHMEMILFIGTAKAWAGLWEALVVYVSLLALVWGSAVIQNLPNEVSEGLKEDDRGYHWSGPVFAYLLLIGILVNVFSGMRFIANVAKGSFGIWDQYVSLMTLSPGLVAAAIGACIVVRAHFLVPDRKLYFVSGTAATLFALWLMTWGVVVFALLGYLDGPTEGIFRELVALLKLSR